MSRRKTEALPPARPAEVTKTGMPKRRRITKDDIVDAALMLDRDHSVPVIAKRLGLTEYQVEKIKEKRIELKTRTDVIKNVLGDFWYTLADEAMAQITEEKLKELSVPQLVTVAAIATDKARLLEGKPTEIIAAYEEVINRYVVTNATKGQENESEGAVIDVTYNPVPRERSASPFEPVSEPLQYGGQDAAGRNRESEGQPSIDPDQCRFENVGKKRVKAEVDSSDPGSAGRGEAGA